MYYRTIHQETINLLKLKNIFNLNKRTWEGSKGGRTYECINSMEPSQNKSLTLFLASHLQILILIMPKLKTSISNYIKKVLELF